MKKLTIIFLISGLLWVVESFAMSKDKGPSKKEFYEPSINFNIAGVWQGKMFNDEKECFYYIITKKEPLIQELPALKLENGNLYSFNFVNGKLDKKRVDLSENKKLFSNLDFTKDQEAKLNKKQCEFIPSHGGHPTSTFVYLYSTHKLQLVVIGASPNENQRLISKMNLPENKKKAIAQTAKEQTIYLVTGSLFVSLFPKTLPENCRFSEEFVYPISGYLIKNELFLSSVAFNKDYGSVESITTLRLVLKNEKKLEGTHSYLEPWNNSTMTLTPMTYTRELELKK